jgi:hypothetical protein
MKAIGSSGTCFADNDEERRTSTPVQWLHLINVMRGCGCTSRFRAFSHDLFTAKEARRL